MLHQLCRVATDENRKKAIKCSNKFDISFTFCYLYDSSKEP